MIARVVAKSALALVALALVATAGVAITSSPVQARVFVGFGFGPFWGYPGYPYYPYPYAYPYPYYAPPVVYGAPAYSAAPPAYDSAATAPAPATWYYCDNPAGYYPYVKHCSLPWRPVAAQPQQ